MYHNVNNVKVNLSDRIFAMKNIDHGKKHQSNYKMGLLQHKIKLTWYK